MTGSAQTALGQPIPRPQVSGRLRGALERGSLLVVAEAGFGKTLALEEALRGWWPAAWVTCGEADRDPGSLVGSVLAAVGRALPGAVDVLAGRLTAGGGTVDPLLALRELAAEVESLLIEPLVVVLDDAERLHDSEGAIASIAELLGARSRLRVAVATRRELPLKIAKRQASGALTVLRSADLAFTAEECARFLSARLGRDPRREEVTGAMEATAGWPLGLELGAAGGEPLVRARASRRATFEYLAEEVLAGVEPELRERLLDSSVAPELSPPVTESLGLPEDFVEQVQRSGLFLRRLETTSDAYAYHPLFREFLLDRLRRRRPQAELRRLHALTARGLGASGRAADAVEHWLEAHDWTQAIAAMARASPALRRTSPATLHAWLERLPATSRREPACLLIEGQLASNEGDYERGIPLLREAIAAGRRAHDLEGEWTARWALSAVLFSTGDFAEMDRLADGWEALDPETAPLGALGAAFFRACGHAVVGRGDEAEALIGRIAATRVGALFVPALRVGARAITETAAGRIDAAVERLEAAMDELDLSDPTGMQVGTAATLALVQMDIGEYDAALVNWRRTSAAARAFGVSWVARQADWECALALALQGRLVDAQLALERAGPPLGTGWRDHTLYKAQAATAALRDDVGGARVAAERALELATRAPAGFQVSAAAELVPILEAGGAGGRAREVVDDVLDLVDRQFAGRRGSFLRARLLAARAWLHERDGRGSAAEDDLARSFAEAGDAAHHVLRRDWARLEPIVWRALERGLIDPLPAIRALQAGLSGVAVVPLVRHPRPAVRQAAISAAAASGHPHAIRSIEQLSREDDPVLARAAIGALERLSERPPALSLTLLGRFSVTRGSWQADDAAWERRVAQRLVRFLLLHRDRLVSEEELLDAFWPGRDPSRARRSLHVAASRARAVLDVAGASSVIEIADRMYRLRLREGDSVDADRYEAVAVAALRERGPARARLLAHAASAWGGEPLPEERYADWALGWRERLLDLHANVLAALAGDCLEQGDLLGAGLRSRELVRLDPLNESGHRLLMVAHARAGRRGEALRQFLACRRALVDRLGVEPASDTARLHERILAGDPV